MDRRTVKTKPYCNLSIILATLLSLTVLTTRGNTQTPPESTTEIPILEPAPELTAPTAPPDPIAPADLISPTEKTPTESVPTTEIPAAPESTPSDSSKSIISPSETAPVNTVPVNTVPVNTAPVNTTPADTTKEVPEPVNTAPVNTAPVNTAPVNTAPVDTVPASTPAAMEPTPVISPSTVTPPAENTTAPLPVPTSPSTDADLKALLPSSEPVPSETTLDSNMPLAAEPAPAMDAALPAVVVPDAAPAATVASMTNDDDALDLTGSFIFGVQYGFHFFDEQFYAGNSIRNRASLGLRLGYALLPHFDIELPMTYVPSRAGAFDLDLFTYNASLVFNLFHNHHWTPYASAGLGVYHTSTPFLAEDNNDFAVFYAAGLKWFFYHATALRLETRFISVFTDRATNLETTLGLVIYANVFQARDRDHDGLIGAQDRCPDQAEDMDGFEDSDGCPDKDNDKDGIADGEDRCPNQAEDIDGFEDNDGCPDLDNDHDGIADIQDRCPNQAEDKDGFEDEDGCPEADNDHDGITDAQDQCPNQAETFNKIADEDGCPDEKLLKFSGIIPGINFASGSNIIDTTSFPHLDEAAEALKESPAINITIAGHTDNVGSAKDNLRLSKARAEAVRQYLIAKGVSPFRLRIIGYGETRPIASNSTETGKAQNRRIEFKLEDIKQP